MIIIYEDFKTGVIEHFYSVFVSGRSTWRGDVYRTRGFRG